MDVPEHGDAEGPVVVVPGELLGAAAVVLLARAAGVGRRHPGAPARAVVRLGDLLTTGKRYQVSKDC